MGNTKLDAAKVEGMKFDAKVKVFPEHIVGNEWSNMLYLLKANGKRKAGGIEQQQPAVKRAKEVDKGF